MIPERRTAATHRGTGWSTCASDGRTSSESRLICPYSSGIWPTNTTRPLVQAALIPQGFSPIFREHRARSEEASPRVSSAIANQRHRCCNSMDLARSRRFTATALRLHGRLFTHAGRVPKFQASEGDVCKHERHINMGQRSPAARTPEPRRLRFRRTTKRRSSSDWQILGNYIRTLGSSVNDTGRFITGQALLAALSKAQCRGAV